MPSAAEIRAHLTGSACLWDVRSEEEVSSTSDELKRTGVTDVPLVLFADHQTNGRGRRENVWTAPRGLDVMMSLAWRPVVPTAFWPRATSLAALGVCEAIEAEVPLEAKIKWPNDILVGGKKVAGLLAETSSPGGTSQLVLGIGVNVNNKAFPPELQNSATSLLLELRGRTAREIDRSSFAAQLLMRLEERLSMLEDGYAEALVEIRRRSWLLHRQIRAQVQGRDVYGRAVDLNGEGELVVELPDGTRTILVSVEGVREVVR